MHKGAVTAKIQKIRPDFNHLHGPEERLAGEKKRHAIASTFSTADFYFLLPVR